MARALPRGWREGGWEAGERVGFREEEDAAGEEDKRGGKREGGGFGARRIQRTGVERA